jgi:histone H3/H4
MPPRSNAVVAKAAPKFSPSATGADDKKKKRHHRALRDLHPLRVYVARILRKVAADRGMQISRNAVVVVSAILENEGAEIASRAGRAAGYERVRTLKSQHLQNPIGLMYQRSPELAELMLRFALKAVKAYEASVEKQGAPTPAPKPLQTPPAPASEGYDDSDDSPENSVVA